VIHERVPGTKAQTVGFVEVVLAMIRAYDQSAALLESAGEAIHLRVDLSE
jgi:hypothetical protein